MTSSTNAVYRGDEHDRHPRIELLYKAWGLLRAADDAVRPPAWHRALDDWLHDARTLLVEQTGGE